MVWLIRRKILMAMLLLIHLIVPAKMAQQVPMAVLTGRTAGANGATGADAEGPTGWCNGVTAHRSSWCQGANGATGAEALMVPWCSRC